MKIAQLPSGYWHIRGRGPCNWSQPPCWPCDEAALRAHAHPEAGERFLRMAMAASRDAMAAREKARERDELRECLRLALPELFRMRLSMDSDQARAELRARISKALAEP